MPLALLLALLPAAESLPRPRPAPLDAAGARALLGRHCLRCHGDPDAAEGGLARVTDFPKLSRLSARLRDGSMPPEGAARPDADAVAAFAAWVESGAPGSATPPPEPAGRVVDRVRRDLDSLAPRSRRFARYLSLAHLPAADVPRHRLALAKLLNSLSWHPKIRNPVPVDAAGDLLRIDLRWYQWDATLWNRVLAEYPWGVQSGSVAERRVAVETACRVPVVRGDWLIALASRPPLYRDLLQLPGSLTELERQLRVDASLDLLQERAFRVGFTGSGVSRNNRVLERHDSAFGYYWRTFDFEEIPQQLLDRGRLAPDRRNVFAYPLGPGNADNAFLHAGGEAIFSLPNGLQGYFLTDAPGNRVDKGPVAIVSDPKRPDRAVELGVSCMSCHVTGVLSKEDQVRDFLNRNPHAIPPRDTEVAKALYPPKAVSLAAMTDDAGAFRLALEKTGNTVTPTADEPVSGATRRYEADVDAATAAAELGTSADSLRSAIRATPALAQRLGALLTPGSAVPRPVWAEAFPSAVSACGLGTAFDPGTVVTTLPDLTGEVDPLEGGANEANAAVFAPDGRTLLVAGADRAVRRVETVGGREARRFVGHAGGVWSVALSPDGKTIASGSIDGTARLWNAERGEPLFTLEGHRGLVSAVAFAPDGGTLYSGGFDGRVLAWEVATGKRLDAWDADAAGVQTLAVSPDGQSLAVAAGRRVLLWDAAGKPLARSPEWPAEPTALAFAPDGRTLAAGRDDGRADLLDARDLRSTRSLPHAAGSVGVLAWDASGGWLLVGGADRVLRLVRASDGNEVAGFSKHAGAIAGATFTPGGRQTVSVSRDGAVRVWDVWRWTGR